MQKGISEILQITDIPVYHHDTRINKTRRHENMYQRQNFYGVSLCYGVSKVPFFDSKTNNAIKRAHTYTQHTNGKINNNTYKGVYI